MTTPFVGDVKPVNAAQELCDALAAHRIPAKVHNGYGLALVVLWDGLNVWCNGQSFWWHAGWNRQRQQAVYAWHPTGDVPRAARRVAFRCAQLRGRTFPVRGSAS